MSRILEPFLSSYIGIYCVFNIVFHESIATGLGIYKKLRITHFPFSHLKLKLETRDV